MIEKRSGTIRSKRLNSNLLDSPFQIDQLSFEDLIGYMSSFLEKLNYYDLDNQINGNWKVFVEADPIIYIVTIINQPFTELKSITQNHSVSKTASHNNLTIALLLEKAYDQIIEWQKKLLLLGEDELSFKIESIWIDVLGEQKNNLSRYIITLQNKEVNERKISSSTDEKINLNKQLHNFEKLVKHIQKLAKDFLEKNLLNSHNHAPNNAMYIAFSLLYKAAQAQINTLSKRHLDFYYKNVLKQTHGKGLPTKAIVNFDLLPNNQSVIVKKHTKLSAGKLFDSIDDIIFETTKPLIAHQVQLQELETLLFKRNPLINIGTDLPTISSVQKKALIENSKRVDPYNDWFAFGANKKTIDNAQINDATAAELGFIIGSPILSLSEGRRNIQLQINFEKQTAKTVFWSLLNQIKNNREISMETVVNEIFKDGFIISYTNKKGWLAFDSYAIDFNEEKNYITINLVLDTIDLALEKTLKTDEELAWPSIKVTLNEYAPTYLYSFFKSVEVNTIKIDVDVERMRNISLYNNVGKIALGKPFDLFGPIPKENSYLMIGKSEWFKKQITDLSIHIEWDNLPSDFGGFETYYESYSKAITDESFKVQFSVLSNNYWLPTNLKYAPVANLFTSKNILTPEGYKTNVLCQQTDIELDEFQELNVAIDYNLADPLKYVISSESGFIKLTLIEPTMGFGNNEYQKDFTTVATYNAKNKTNIPYPNKPFVPKVKEISVNYSSSATLSFNQQTVNTEENVGEFYHIAPFWINRVIKNTDIKSQTLLSNFTENGYLSMGFVGVKDTTTLSIYFDFLNSSSIASINNKPIIWEYYDVNTWKQFGRENIITDGTNQFIKSGIVEIILPKVPLEQSDGVYWVRISTQNHAEDYPIIRGVYLNAVEVICTNTASNIIGKKIPKESITKLLEKNSSIKKVTQPEVSYGGITIETDVDFYTRVSERLRHKSRVVTLWDYERIVLENFKDISVVKCTNFDEKFKPSPGKIKVILLSEKWTNEEEHYINKDTLNNVKQFLLKKSNPFVKLEVINPEVEYLLVNTIVELMPEDNSGYYITQLNQDISNFLSPISNIKNGIGGIGGRVVPNAISSFIANLPYINKVDKLAIEHIVSDGVNEFVLDIHSDGQEIIVKTPWSILAPVKQHHIKTTLDMNSLENNIKVGIGTMEIGVDFILGEETKHEIVKTQDGQDKKSNNAILVFKNN